MEAATASLTTISQAIAAAVADLGDIPPGALQVKDLTNGMLCHAAEAWIMKAPKVERAKESGTIQYVFECAKLDFTVATPELA